MALTVTTLMAATEVTMTAALTMITITIRMGVQERMLDLVRKCDAKRKRNPGPDKVPIYTFFSRLTCSFFGPTRDCSPVRPCLTSVVPKALPAPLLRLLSIFRKVCPQETITTHSPWRVLPQSVPFLHTYLFLRGGPART